MNKKTICCVIFALTGLAYGCSLDNFVSCDEGAMMCEGNDVMQCINSGYVRVKTCDVACENAACIICDKSINPTKCASQYLIQSDQDTVDVVLDQNNKAENLSLTVTYLVNGVADSGHKLLVTTNNTACIAVNTSEVTTGNNAVIGYHATTSSSCDAELYIEDKDSRAKQLTIPIKVWDYKSDNNNNHFHDLYESSAPNFGKTCRVDTDCDSAEGAADGFCDSFSGFTCAKRCTSNDQCIQNVDGFNFVCRQDGRCASDAFVIEESGKDAVIPLDSSDDAKYTIDWGDGQIEEFDSTSTNELNAATHTYDNDNNHIIHIKGTYHFSINDTYNLILLDNRAFNAHQYLSDNLIAVKAFGPVGLQAGAFQDCHSLTTLSYVDIPDSTQLNDLTNLFNSAFICVDCKYDYALLPNWDLSHVKNTSHMFDGATAFNANISRWNVSNVTDMSYMFMQASAFNQNIGAWNVSNVTDMNNMFRIAPAFNQDIGAWNVSNVTDMNNMFSGASAFNQDIGAWDVSNVNNMNYMFSGASAFNQDIGAWDVSNVNNMSYMFNRASAFNQDLDEWKTGNVTNMSYMFANCDAFNGKISRWNVSNVTNMDSMFYYASAFNQDIGAWDVSNVTSMIRMFLYATTFNQDLDEWKIDKVTDTSDMFNNAQAFNGNVLSWKPISCKNMVNMFNGDQAFSQDIGDWPTAKRVSTFGMFGNTNQTMNAIVESWKTRTCNKDAMTLSCQFNESN